MGQCTRDERVSQCFSLAGLRMCLKKVSRRFLSNSLALARQALQLQLTRAKTFNQVSFYPARGIFKRLQIARIYTYTLARRFKRRESRCSFLHLRDTTSCLERVNNSTLISTVRRSVRIYGQRTLHYTHDRASLIQFLINK